MKFNNIATTVESVSDELKMGCSQFGRNIYKSGNISTLNPKHKARPIIKIILTSGFDCKIICRPEKTIKLMTNNKMAPITGPGIIEKMAAILGEKPNNV